MKTLNIREEMPLSLFVIECCLTLRKGEFQREIESLKWNISLEKRLMASAIISIHLKNPENTLRVYHYMTINPEIVRSSCVCDTDFSDLPGLTLIKKWFQKLFTQIITKQSLNKELALKILGKFQSKCYWKCSQLAFLTDKVKR